MFKGELLVDVEKLIVTIYDEVKDKGARGPENEEQEALNEARQRDYKVMSRNLGTNTLHPLRLISIRILYYANNSFCICFHICLMSKVLLKSAYEIK